MELEDDHDFAVEITGAGSMPFASLGSPVVTTVTIEDDESECCFGDVLVHVAMCTYIIIISVENL